MPGPSAASPSTGCPSSPIITGAFASGPAYVASRSMISLKRIFPSINSSCQMIIAWKVNGLSQSPAIIASRPASMRLAMAISPSLERRSTVPISRRYMRTGSSVRSEGSLAVPVFTIDLLFSAMAGVAASVASSTSSSSTTLMPISESMDIISSICSEDTSSDGITSFSSSYVT